MILKEYVEEIYIFRQHTEINGL